MCGRCLGARWVNLRSATALGLFALPEVDFGLPETPPDLPEGPDEWLTMVAELERQVAQERARLEATGGARRCRYCQLDVPPGPGAGVHEACLPRRLPEGARSCAGCGELILDEDDEFEHDFCDCPGDETPGG